MNISTIFFDLDDTLYPSSSGLWSQIKNRIGLFMNERLAIPDTDVPLLRKKLFDEYGTTLRGLQANYSFEMDDFLAYVHDIPLADYIQPDPILHGVLNDLPARKFIFTNADANHARRVMRVLQIEEFFDGIIDINMLEPYCKPMLESFKIALDKAGETDPHKCAMIDDLSRTTRAARELGLFSILCEAGPSWAESDADVRLSDWSNLPGLLNGRK
jgi:pyrimidine 5'-nucleotidase